MAEKINPTGQIVLQEGNDTLMTFKMEDAFGVLDNIQEHEKSRRTLIIGDGVVTLSKGGVSTVRGFLLYIKSGSGTVTLKHDGNANGMVISKGVLLYGSIDTVTVETADTQGITIEYLFVE